MSSAPFTRRIPKKFKKTITFAAVAGQGAVGTVAVGTVTGQVLLLHAQAVCLTDLTSGGAATIEMGVAGDTAGILAQITATAYDAGEWWETTPSKVAAAIVDRVVSGDITITVATADVTGGSIEIEFYWLPMSDNGNIA